MKKKQVVQPTQQKSHPGRFKGDYGKKSERRRRRSEKDGTKMAKRFEGILTKKEDACVSVKLSKVKGQKKAGRFTILMAAAKIKVNLEEKKIKLEERRVELVPASWETKMLTMRTDELDCEAAMIVHAVCVKMLKRLVTEMNVAKRRQLMSRRRRQSERGGLRN